MHVLVADTTHLPMSTSCPPDVIHMIRLPSFYATLTLPYCTEHKPKNKKQGRPGYEASGSLRSLVSDLEEGLVKLRQNFYVFTKAVYISMVYCKLLTLLQWRRTTAITLTLQLQTWSRSQTLLQRGGSGNETTTDCVFYSLIDSLKFLTELLLLLRASYLMLGINEFRCL